MRFDIDTYNEILNTLTRNKSRSLLTGFGVFWGVFMLIFLLGGGNGLKEMLEKNFAGFAHNSSMIWAQPTSKAYKGMKKGRTWYMTMKDAERLRHLMPELDVIAPTVYAGGTDIFRGEKSAWGNITGVTSDYRHIEVPKIKYGRYINDTDVMERRKVCVIGKSIYKTLFPDGENPCGTSVKVNNVYYQIIGVDYKEANGINIGGNAANRIIIPHTTLRTIYRRGEAVDIIAITGKENVVMSRIAPKIRSIIAREHSIAPDDEVGIQVFHTEAIFTMTANLFKGVNFMIWLVGLGTLLAGAIGVSNIMMVTVKERTSEIGIRRAIGAKPATILSQIIMESMLLTIAAGIGGIMLGILLLQGMELGTTTDGVPTAHFQIDFWLALFSTLLLCVLGGLAGLAPAWRAMKVKPVDAMRDE